MALLSSTQKKERSSTVGLMLYLMLPNGDTLKENRSMTLIKSFDPVNDASPWKGPITMGSSEPKSVFSPRVF